METDCIKFEDTGCFSKIVVDYLNGAAALDGFYAHAPQIDAFSKAIEERNFPLENRGVLFNSLLQQYQQGQLKLKERDLVLQNLQSLKEKNTFTVTTGHQLCLFTGPLYFVYKIISIVNLAKRLAEKHPNKKFVPIYWMASEDHDFEEISFFRLKGKTLKWNTKQSGAVGRMKTKELQSILEELKEILLPYSTHSAELISLFEKAYLQHENLADASRYLVHELFKDDGVVVVDGDDQELKRLFIPQLKEELENEISSQLVEKQSKELGRHYKLQVNPREINLFYLEEGKRNRILKKGEEFIIHNTEETFSSQAFYELLKNHPERFSPNVLLRPVYQEVILPNLAYIGGGGELAYWFQLKSTFEHLKVPMPMLLLRNSALWMDEKSNKYATELKLTNQQLFQSEGVLLKEWVKTNAKEDISLDKEKETLTTIYEQLSKKAASIDPTLKSHTLALAEKQKQQLTQLSEKLIRQERRKQKEATARVAYLKETLFPNNSLQERTDNFSLLYLVYGKEFVAEIMNAFELPTKDFVILKEKI